jgi:hypothetical protein
MPRYLSPLHRPTLGALVMGLMLCATTHERWAKVVKANNVKVE